jgi:predicted Na+-dependent transporter
MFNADLALSVTMTAISTLFSVITLPLNLLIYARLAYDDDVISSIDWKGLFVSLAVVISAIGLGLLASYHYNSHNFNLHANRLGNFSGIALVIFSAFLSNSDSDMQIWDRDWKFFIGVAAPCFLGLVVSNLIATCIELRKPERVTVSIECVYQNVGIATSVALAMFDGEDQAEAMGVPFYYGMVEAVIISTYCIGAWKFGWTKAPRDVPFWTSITTSYEILSVEQAEKQEDGVLVESPVAENVDEEFQYVSHEDAPDETGDPSNPSNPPSPARRQPIVNKGKKEPSYIATPTAPA